MMTRAVGIVVLMMLVGVMLALPASAAPMGDVAGTIEFKDEKGGDAITHVSLNGPAAETNGFWFQISDPDVTHVRKVEGKSAYVATIDSAITPPDGVFWYDVVDKNGDGWVDSRDITGAVIANPNDPATKSVTVAGVDLTAPSPGGPGCAVNFDKTNSALDVSGCSAFDHDNDGTQSAIINALEFWVEQKQIIGGREGKTRTGNVQATASGGDITVDVPAPNTTPGNPGATASLWQPQFATPPTTWLPVLELTLPSLRADINKATLTEGTVGTNDALQAQVRTVVNARNSGENQPLLAINATFTKDNTSTTDTDETAVTLTVVDGADAKVGDANKDGLREGGPVPIEFQFKGRVARDSSTLGSPQLSQSVYAYMGAASEVGRVVISSRAATEDLSVLLEETGAASGVFGANIQIISVCPPPSPGDETTCTNLPRQSETSLTDTGLILIPVYAERDTITITYKDDSPAGPRTASVVVDPSAPSFSGFAPASGFASRDDEPTVSFEARDGASGISTSKDDVGSVYVVAGVYDLGEAVSRDSVVYERNEVKLTEVTDGYAASVTIEEGTDDKDELNSGLLDNDDEYEIRWWAVAVDKAGNVGVSDRDSATDCVSADLNNATNSALLEFSGARTQAQSDAIIRALEGTYKKQVGKSGDANYEKGKGCDPHVVRVDVKAPTLVSAVTGSWLDGDVEKSGTDAIRTSVAAVFHEELDCDTVSADDFTVGGSAPTGVTCKKEKAYLEVSELAADAKPKVVVASGSLADLAGNAIGGTDASRTMTAEDGIAAKLTVTVTGTGEGDRPVTDKTITIHITSDERLSGRPKVSIRKVGDNYGLSNDVSGDEEGQAASPTGKSNEWSLKRDFADGTGVDADGLYNVSVLAQDRGSSIKATTGLSKFDRDSLKDKKAILFEVDNEVQAPTFHPTNGSKTDTEDLFVTASFKLEGTEYGLDAARKLCRRSSDKNTVPQDDAGACPDGYAKYEPQHATSDASKVSANFDTHKTLTMMSATFDGEDVKDAVESRDNVTFVYRPTGAAVGEHTFELKVKDNAGNEGTFKLEFTKTERVKWKLPIHPGANLISLPAEPVDGSIDAVFGGEPEVTTVTTYDGASGLWSVAARGADGKFVGDLESIDAKHGYWVVSDGALDVSVTLVRGGAISVSPAYIEVASGWNLVSVADVRQRDAGTGIDTHKYFANIDADVAYGYDALTGAMVRLSLAKAAKGQTQDQVKIGMGYWVYANEAGVIVP